MAEDLPLAPFEQIIVGGAAACGSERAEKSHSLVM